MAGVARGNVTWWFECRKEPLPKTFVEISSLGRRVYALVGPMDAWDSLLYKSDRSHPLLKNVWEALNSVGAEGVPGLMTIQELLMRDGRHLYAMMKKDPDRWKKSLSLH